MSTGNSVTGPTYTYALCPGCNEIHRTSNCPDDECICCEAIAVPLVTAPLDVAMDEARRQMEKWKTTLDWLAQR